MNSSLQTKVNHAISLLREIRSALGTSNAERLDALQEVQEELEQMIEAVEMDIEHKEDE